MTKVQRYWSMGLSGLCLALALCFSFTPAAWLLIGSLAETYPELFFIVYVTPPALLAFVLSSLGMGRASYIASVALSGLCFALAIFLLWPRGGAAMLCP